MAFECYCEGLTASSADPEEGDDDIDDDDGDDNDNNDDVDDDDNSGDDDKDKKHIAHAKGSALASQTGTWATSDASSTGAART